MIGTPSALAPHGPLTFPVVSPIVGSLRRACCTKRSSRSAHSCPCEPHRGSLFRFRPVSQSLHLFVLPHLHYVHDSASLATACSPSTRSRSTTAVVANSSRTRLLGPSTSSSSPLLPPSLLFLFTRPDRPLPNGYASGQNFLLIDACVRNLQDHRVALQVPFHRRPVSRLHVQLGTVPHRIDVHRSRQTVHFLITTSNCETRCLPKAHASIHNQEYIAVLGDVLRLVATSDMSEQCFSLSVRIRKDGMSIICLLARMSRWRIKTRAW